MTRTVAATHRRPALRDNRGFSLLELVLVLVILGVVAAVAAPPIATTVEGLLTARTQADLRSELYGAVDRMSHAIRGAAEVSCESNEITVTEDEIDRTFALQQGRLQVTINGADAGALIGGEAMPVTRFDCESDAFSTTGLFRITLEVDERSPVETYVFNRAS